MERVLVAPMVTAMGIGDHFSIYSPNENRQIYGRSEYYASLKKHNVLPLSDVKGEAEHQQKQLAAKEKAERRETIERAIAKHS